MKDWLPDVDRDAARSLGLSVKQWRRYRQAFIDSDLFRAEVHPVEGPILRLVHPEHLAAMGMLLGTKVRP